MKYHSLIFLALLGFVIGCGSGQVDVQGRVVFSDDGSPVPGGNIVFTTSTFQARGILDEQGRFTMGSYGNADGLPPGTYQVGVSGAFIDLDESGLRTYELIDPKYGGPATSGIEITIEKTTRDLVIEVGRNPAPRPTR